MADGQSDVGNDSYLFLILFYAMRMLKCHGRE